MVLPSGRFFKVKDRIRDAAGLQRWLVRYRPTHVYYSTATYLNPTAVRPRPKEREGFLRSGILLDHDIAFDLDRQPLTRRTLERTRGEAVRLLEFMEAKGHRLKYAAFSGSKGFHLLFDDPDWETVADPFEREQRLIVRRRALTEKVIAQGIAIDTSVTVDTRRIIRVPGTINSRTGHACTRLTPEELVTPVDHWLPLVKRLPSHSPIQRFNWPTLRSPRLPLPERETQRPVRAGFTTFVLSPVLGLKGRHAILMSFPNWSRSRVERKLVEVMERYQLSDVYLFALMRSVQAICPKTVQRNRYQKILDASASASAKQLRRYGRVSLRMGPLVDGSLHELEPPAEFFNMLEAPEQRERSFVSAGHLNFMRRHGMEPLTYPRVHGSDEFKVIDAQLRL